MRPLKLMIRGPHRHEIQLQPPRTQPESLKATLGEPQDLGNVLAVPMTIEIPAGTSAESHLGENAGGLVRSRWQPTRRRWGIYD